MVKKRIILPLFLLIAAFTLISGCKTSKISKNDQKLVEKFGENIKNICHLAGYEGIRVSGYSLVWGLQGTGSAECPPDIRSFLIKHIQVLKASDKTYLTGKFARMTAEQLINSTDTAVVRISGIVPAGAPAKTKFDVNVYIPFASQTTSLEGGMLLPASLRRVEGGIPGRDVAKAGGPIYIDPLPIIQDGEVKKADKRFGVVLGGGLSEYDRKIKLVLLEPDSRVAQLVQKRINSRFPLPGNDKVAMAQNREYLTITIPEEHKQDYNYFIKVLLKLYLNDTAAYQEQKLAELEERTKLPDADFEDITLSWEAIGKGALTKLKELCENLDTVQAYYAARTILNMNDLSVIKPLSLMARNENHPCKYKAASTLGKAVDDPMASWTLAGLLNSNDDKMRMIAYDALRKGNHSHIYPILLQNGSYLDSVKSSAKNMICAWAALEPRIAVFGRSIPVKDNIFYKNEAAGIVINSLKDESIITITRQLPESSKFVKMSCPATVENIIAKLSGALKEDTGAGMSFGQTIGILYDMCEAGFIEADFKMKRISEKLE